MNAPLTRRNALILQCLVDSWDPDEFVPAVQLACAAPDLGDEMWLVSEIRRLRATPALAEVERLGLALGAMQAERDAAVADARAYCEQLESVSVQLRQAESRERAARENASQHLGIMAGCVADEREKTRQAEERLTEARDLGQKLCDERDAAVKRYQGYEDGITWMTTCLNCAHMMTGRYEDTCLREEAIKRAEQAEAEIALFREQRLGWRFETEKAEAENKRLRAALEAIRNYASPVDGYPDISASRVFDATRRALAQPDPAATEQLWSEAH